MRDSATLREFNISLRIEQYIIQIIDGNWGVFEESFPNHMHSYYEMHYVSEGRGTLVLEDIERPLCRGCVYLIPPKTYHEQRTHQQEKLKEYHFAFVLTAPADNSAVYWPIFSKVFFCGGMMEMEPIFTGIFLEIELMRFGYRDIIRSYVQSVLILLMRTISEQKKDAMCSTYLEDQRVMMTDEALLYEYKTITLSALSSRLKLSSRQTQRFIVDQYGEPFSALKTKSRLNHAKMLLSTTDLSLDEICDQVGYQSTTYFQKIFKLFFHQTPSCFR